MDFKSEGETLDLPSTFLQVALHFVFAKRLVRRSVVVENLNVQGFSGTKILFCFETVSYLTFFVQLFENIVGSFETWLRPISPCFQVCQHYTRAFLRR